LKNALAYPEKTPLKNALAYLEKNSVQKRTSLPGTTFKNASAYPGKNYF
jgi:hypothetical protein